jgi:hypothetical protein
MGRKARFQNTTTRPHNQQGNNKAQDTPENSVHGTSLATPEITKTFMPSAE